MAGSILSPVGDQMAVLLYLLFDANGEKMFNASGSSYLEQQVAGLRPKPTEPTSIDPAIATHLRDVIQREQNFLLAQEQPHISNRALGNDSLPATTLWLERTRWPTIFKGSRRDILKAMIRLPRRHIDSLSRSGYIISQGLEERDPTITSFIPTY
ncbi:hypothetical protein BGZ63DRAFT_409320 [Mariannaea sp. PMI_226]|nr:hypothetical protein BGZ63DRAFT_409320 [Mariannaea sp. PMI_226]